MTRIRALASAVAVSWALAAPSRAAEPQCLPPVMTEQDFASTAPGPAMQEQGERRARYLRGLALLREGRAEEAATELEGLAPRYPAIADRVWLRAGEAWAAARRWAEAARAFGQVTSGSPIHAVARLELARALREQGKAREAIASLKQIAALPAPASGRDFGAEALVEQASIAREIGDAAAEREALLRLWRDHPTASIVEGIAERIGKASLQARVERAERLAGAHQNQQAIVELGPLLGQLELPDPIACRAHLVVGDSLRKERKHRKAIALLEPVVERCPAQEERALFALASSKSIAFPSSGPALYDRFARRFPSFSRLDQIHWFAAALELQAGKDEAARERLESIARRWPKGELAPEALFKLFWLDWRAGKLDSASATLERLLARYGGRAYEQQRALYWQARLLAARGEQGKAIETLAEIATNHPVSYYGVAALWQLDKLAPGRAAKIRALGARAVEAASFRVETRRLACDPHAVAAVELLRLGLREEAIEELSVLAERKPAKDEVRLIATLLARAGDAKTSHMLARVQLASELEGRPDGTSLATWRLAYPRPWRDQVERHCASAGVEPDLLQALMREESALDPRARSWAGAVGLTQLLPQRGASVSRSLGAARFEPQELLEPERSIELGCAWLGELVRRYDGEVAYAYAAYNAEPKRIDRWLQAKKELPIDEWIEEIPIAETRGYVKRLLRTLAAYRLLYARER